MYFRMLHDEAGDTMSYLLADLNAGAAVLIDPRSADLAVLHAMLDEHRLQLQRVLFTHLHQCQHEGGSQPTATDALHALGAPCIARQVPRANDGVLVFGNEHIRVIATPGHTPDCLSFLWRDRLFCGGLLAVDACSYQPRPALPESLWDSVMQKVFTLPAETLLFSGHAHRSWSISNVFEQRRRHPWFAGANRDEFLARVATPALTY